MNTRSSAVDSDPLLLFANPSTLSEFQDALRRSQNRLLQLQQPDGHWIGELQGDTILESEYILLMAFLGKEADPTVRLTANYLRDQQLPEGGWANYPGGPAEISTSVKGYLALKIAGHAPEEPLMQKALQAVHRLGGAEKCNSFTRFYLAMLGQAPYANCPAVPPEIILFPTWFYFNIYAMSAWSRTIFVPLSVVWAHKPVRPLSPQMSIPELFLDDPMKRRPPAAYQGRFTWTNFFLRIDSCFKWLEWLRLTPVRKRAIRKAVQWMREHYVDSDGIGAIFPPMIYTVIVLKCLGVSGDDPEMQWAMKQIQDLMIPEGDTLRLQPCLSPVWDTALTLIALADTGLNQESVQVQEAVEWLLHREIRRPGDWSRMNPNLQPGGWCFEYRNGFYPDTDDTSMVLIALSRTGFASQSHVRPAVDRALNWLLGMQNKDGGWAAFDRDINRAILEKVPFADHNAMLDPSCPDITARVLEALGHFGFRPGMKSVDLALKFIERTQEPDGSWKGRWGVNYIYGTWQVLVGLREIGFNMQQPMVRKAVAWLKSVQQMNGSWGESCRSYDDPSTAGEGIPTASQTAWAILGLQAAGESQSNEVQTGIEYLLSIQESDGTWNEEPFTGTGFPKVFYLKYHLYSQYFPTMALARHLNMVRD